MTISIALTKGRIENGAIDILKRANFGVDELNNKGRRLVFNDTKEPVKYFLVKAADTVTYIEHGVADIAIVGKDTLLEVDTNFYEVLDLGIGKCKFIVASLPDSNLFNRVGHIKIATKYPKVARKFFSEKNMDVEIIKIEGSVELAPILGICNGIVDIMETGSTLKENGLVVLEEIQDISTRVIVNKSSFKLKREEINSILAKIKEVIY